LRKRSTIEAGRLVHPLGTLLVGLSADGVLHRHRIASVSKTVGKNSVQ